MKRYIKASISGSMPDWLRKEITRGGYSKARLINNLVNRYNVSLDTANFQGERPTSNNYLTFYLLNPNDNYYSRIVYCPGINDDESTDIGGRYRKLGSIAKSKLPTMAEDVCYLDLSDPNNVHKPKYDRYQDPRYSYRHSSKGTYMGQYFDREYLGNGEYSEEGTWSKTGRIASNERRARDKSGYRIPSPEDMIARYYERFPEKITDKLNAVYDRMLKVKTKLINVNFNTPSEYGSTDLRNAFGRFGDVASEYQKLLAQVDESGRLKSTRGWREVGPKDFSNQVSYINRNLDEVEEYINSFNSEDRR